MIATKLAIKKCLCCNDHDVYFSQKIKFTKITLLKKKQQRTRRVLIHLQGIEDDYLSGVEILIDQLYPSMS